MSTAQIPWQRIEMRDTFAEVAQQYHLWNNLPPLEQEILVRRMERSCFEVVIEWCKQDGINRLFTEPKFINRYSTVCSRVIVNLDVRNNVKSSYLLDGLLDGSIDPYSVARMTSKDLCPTASAAERKEIELRQKQKVVLTVSRAHRCRKCGNNETIPVEYQSRAIDEGSSRSIKCVHCGNIWR